MPGEGVMTITMKGVITSSSEPLLWVIVLGTVLDCAIVETLRRTRRHAGELPTVSLHCFCNCWLAYVQ